MDPIDLSYTTHLAVLILAFLSGMTTLVGVALAIWLGENIKAIAIGIGFSTGIMVLVSIFELIPKSLTASGTGPTWMAVGLGAVLIIALQILIPHTHLVEKRGRFGSRQLKTAYLVAFGLILHDFSKGFAMANTYLSSPALGVLVALAIAIHNVPEEFAMAVPALATKSRRFLFKAGFVSGLAEPAGALLLLFVIHLDPALIPLFHGLRRGSYDSRVRI